MITSINLQIVSFILLLLLYIYTISIFFAFNVYQLQTKPDTMTLYVANMYKFLAIIATIFGALSILGYGISLYIYI